MYGAERAIRRRAEANRIGYVLAVTTGQRLSLCPVAEWFEDQLEALPATETVWQRVSAGAGAKGPRVYDWALIPYRGAPVGFQCALLVRRSLVDPDDLTFYLTHAPAETTLADLVAGGGPVLDNRELL